MSASHPPPMGATLHLPLTLNPPPADPRYQALIRQLDRQVARRRAAAYGLWAAALALTLWAGVSPLILLFPLLGSLWIIQHGLADDPAGLIATARAGLIGEPAVLRLWVAQARWRLDLYPGLRAERAVIQAITGMLPADRAWVVQVTAPRWPWPWPGTGIGVLPRYDLPALPPPPSGPVYDAAVAWLQAGEVAIARRLRQANWRAGAWAGLGGLATVALPLAILAGRMFPAPAFAAYPLLTPTLAAITCLWIALAAFTHALTTLRTRDQIGLAWLTSVPDTSDPSVPDLAAILSAQMRSAPHPAPAARRVLAYTLATLLAYTVAGRGVATPPGAISDLLAWAIPDA